MRYRALNYSIVVSWISLMPVLAAQDSESVFEGVVQDSISGQAIPGVKLTLFRSGGQSGHLTLLQAMSDANGGFRWDNLQPGAYRLDSSKVGYVGSDYRGGKSLTVEVDAVRSSQKLVLRLAPTATIEGRVTGESGEPLPGVTVSAASGA
jgi:hypothetical protein